MVNRVVVVTQDHRGQPGGGNDASPEKTVRRQSYVGKVVDVPVENHFGDHQGDKPDQEQVHQKTLPEGERVYAGDSGEKKIVRTPHPGRSGILLQHRPGVGDGADVADGQLPVRPPRIDEVRIAVLLVEIFVVLQMDVALHEVGRRVGQHAKNTRHVIEPAPVRDGAVHRLVPDREGQVHGQAGDDHVGPEGQRMGGIEGDIADKKRPLGG